METTTTEIQQTPMQAAEPAPIQQEQATPAPALVNNESISPEVKKILDEGNNRVKSEMAFFEETVTRAYRNSVAFITNTQVEIQKAIQEQTKK